MAVRHIVLKRTFEMHYAQQPSVAVCAEACHAQCCRAPGFVRMDTVEMRRLKALNSQVRVLHEPGATGDLWVMQFSERVGACLFLDQKTNLCTIYDQRPEGCATFPVKPTDGCAVWSKGGA